MFNAEYFIEIIKDKPCLWEKQLPEYLNKKCRVKTWQEVGERMYVDWLETNAAKRNERIKIMRTKWRNIRDNFHKHINLVNSNDPAAKKRKQYVYADSLMFLVDHLDSRPTNHFPDDIDDPYEIDGSNSFQEIPATFLSEDRNEEQVPSYSCNHECVQQNATLTAFQSELLKKMNTNFNEGELDADKLFLLSILPDYKNLNEDQKIDFRIMTLHYFREVRRNSK